MANQNLTSKLCECGCGSPVTIYRDNDSTRGYVKGQPARFVTGHSRRTGKAKRYPERGLKRIHVIVAERALGRRLPPGAEVHHVDGDKHNNAPSNLVICQDRAYHFLLHIRQRVLDAGGDPNTQRICCLCKRLTFRADLSGGFKKSNCCKECSRASCRRRRLGAMSA